jgi:hypothetical protein
MGYGRFKQKISGGVVSGCADRLNPPSPPLPAKRFLDCEPDPTNRNRHTYILDFEKKLLTLIALVVGGRSRSSNLRFFVMAGLDPAIH